MNDFAHKAEVLFTTDRTALGTLDKENVRVQIITINNKIIIPSDENMRMIESVFHTIMVAK